MMTAEIGAVGTQGAGAGEEPVRRAPSRPGGRPPEARSLAPREHGAYGQLGVPVVAALGMGRPGLAAFALAAAGALAFAAHEPLLVVVGRRGKRAQKESAPRAWRALVGLGAGALVLGGLGLAAAPAALGAAALAVVLAVAVGIAAARGDERTLLGELAAAAALSAASVPIAIAADVPAASAWGAWAAWCVAFGAATAGVRGVIAHRKNPQPLLRRVAPLLLPGVLAALLAASRLVPAWSALAVAPMWLLSLAISASPPTPAALRRVGWGLVAASLCTGVILVVGARC